MKISVVIGSYNQCHQLERVLTGYLAQVTTVPFEVVVVDSFSEDGTKDMVDAFIRQSPDFNLKFLQRQNPAGKAEARNEGVANASSPIIIITDADMIPDTGFVQAHYEAHASAKTPCCFEGLAYNLKTYDWPPDKTTLQPQVSASHDNNDRLDWYYFLTGNVSFPVDIFNQLNGFSLDFKSYGWEDLELGYRLKKNGIPLYYLTSAVNYHYHVISDKEKVARKYTMGQSAQVFIKKHPELKWFLGLNPLSVFIRRRLSSRHWLVKKIDQMQFSKAPVFRRFSHWFMGEFNYLSGILNL
jgi:GT2 family glycosyltransferase